MTKLPEKFEEGYQADWKGNQIQTPLTPEQVAINQIITYLEEQQKENHIVEYYRNATFTSEKGWHVTLKKPLWCDVLNKREILGYEQALSDVSKALGITINLE